MSGSREVATEVATTELLAERSATPDEGPALRPIPMPNFSGAQTDERLVGLWLADLPSRAPLRDSRPRLEA